MKKTYVCLALGLFLLLFLAAPVALHADTTVYVDTTNSLTRDPKEQEGSQLNPATSLSRGLALMANASGTIIYIFRGGFGTEFCEQKVTNGARDGELVNCKQGLPPGTGEPVAPALLWGLGGGAAVGLILAGFWLRRKSSSVRSAV